MGLGLSTRSNLSTQSYPGSILQDSPNAVFTDKSLLTFPQDVDYFSKTNLEYPIHTAAIVRPSSTPSNLSAQSYPGSILQDCLNSAITDKSLLTFPQDVDYFSKTKPYNSDYPVRPAAIVRPKTVEQVSATVQCAVKAGVKVQPRSGGHSYANHCLGGVDGALVVDLVHLQKFEMDTSTWRATIGAGTLLGDVTKRLHHAGRRAIAHGTCPQVGIGGG